MKNIVQPLAAGIILLAACANSASGKKETAAQPVVTGDTSIPQKMAPPAAGTQQTRTVKDILKSYLQLKNALAGDDDKGAAAAAAEMGNVFNGFDKTALNAEQLAAYNGIEEDARTNSLHISKSGGNIRHQREHFEKLSSDMYKLLKATGGNGKFYYDHCPMYNSGKGADWISETKEIKNPYMGKAMSTCGKLKEELN